MSGRKPEVLEAGKWLAERRKDTGASTTLVARMATLIANRQGDPIKIHQQQISEIENATEDKGPKTLRSWFRYVRAAFDSGLIGDAMQKDEDAEKDKVYFLHDDAGQVVGRLTLFKRAH